MKSKSGISACLKVPSGHQAVLLALCLVLSLSASADTTTLMVTGASKVTSNSPETIRFPVTRSGDTSYPAVLRYHTLNGSASAGAHYTATSGDIIVPAGSISATVPITLAANATGSATLAFQLLLDAATGIGPTPSFAPQQTHTVFGAGAQSVTSADINVDGKPDVVVASYLDSTVSVMLNLTTPGSRADFTFPQRFAVGTNPISATSADINGDGKPDLIVANRGAGTVSVLLNSTAPGANAASFAGQQTFATSSQSVAVADINGDGKTDLIVANAGNAAVSVLLNTTATGAATPSFASQQTFATGNNPFAVTTADVNGDGKPDLIVANHDGSTVSVLLNTTVLGAPTPSFAFQQTFATGAAAQSVAAADVNGDGRPDLIVANYLDSTVSVLLNTTMSGAGTPSFATQETFATGAGPVSVATADVNGDGKPDLLAANANDTAVSVLLNTTAPGASTPSFSDRRSFATGANPQSVTAADVTLDGIPDLLVGNFSANVSANSVSVIHNATAPGAATLTFATQQTFATGTFPVSVTAADLNGDGKLDLTVANFTAATVSVLLGTTAPGATTPSFAAQQSFATGATVEDVAAADVNGDGKPDLIAANWGNSTVAVLLNTTAPGAVAPSFAPPQSFATGSGPWAVTTADVNGDGRPDVIAVGAAVGVLLNTTAPGAATPSFAAQQTFVAGSSPRAVTTSDVNGDGRRDLIAANFNSNTVSVLLNTTAPGATTPSFAAQQAFGTGLAPNSVAAADINGDAKPELIVADSNSDTLSVLVNTTLPGATTPSFAARQTFATATRPVSVSAADVNGDGKSDVIVTNLVGPMGAVRLNTTSPVFGTLSFAPEQTFATGVTPIAVTTGDTNGDGRLDVIVANRSDNTISVLLSRQYQAAVAGGPATGTIVQHYVFANGFE